MVNTINCLISLFKLNLADCQKCLENIKIMGFPVPQNWRILLVNTVCLLKQTNTENQISSTALERSVINSGYSNFLLNMAFISSSVVENIYIS